MKVYVVFYDNGMMWEDHDIYANCIFLNEKDAGDFCYDNNSRLRLSDELYNVEREYESIKEVKFFELIKHCELGKSRKARNKYNDCHTNAEKASEKFMKVKHTELHDRLYELYNMGLSEVESFGYEPFDILEEYIPDKTIILSEKKNE